MNCKLCHTEFEPAHHNQIYCSTCSHLINPHNYNTLSESQRKRSAQLRNLLYSESHIKANKNYRQTHLEEWRDTRNETKLRHNGETLATATKRCERWTINEIDYLKQFAQTKTARQLAIDLNRTYNSVMMKCYNCNIPLLTDAKKHNRLITLNS